MNNALFSLLIFAGSLAAGFIGSLTGLGGGVVIVMVSPKLVTRIGKALTEIEREPVDRAAAVET